MLRPKGQNPEARWEAVKVHYDKNEHAPNDLEDETSNPAENELHLIEHEHDIEDPQASGGNRSSARHTPQSLGGSTPAARSAVPRNRPYTPQQQPERAKRRCLVDSTSVPAVPAVTPTQIDELIDRRIDAKLAPIYEQLSQLGAMLGQFGQLIQQQQQQQRQDNASIYELPLPYMAGQDRTESGQRRRDSSTEAGSEEAFESSIPQTWVRTKNEHGWICSARKEPAFDLCVQQLKCKSTVRITT